MTTAAPTKLTLAHLIECVAKGGFLYNNEEYPSSVLRHGGFRVVKYKDFSYLIGTQPLARSTLSYNRALILAVKSNLPHDLLEILAEQRLDMVMKYLQPISAIFTHPFILSHFTKAPIFVEPKEGERNMYKISFDDWKRQSIRLGIDYYLGEVLADIQLKHVISVVHDVLKVLEYNYMGKSYTIPTSYKPFKVHSAAPADLCLFEILETKGPVVEHEWLLKQYLNVADIEYPYFLCSKKNVGTLTQPAIVIKDFYKTIKEAVAVYMTHSNRTVVVINTDKGLDEYLKNNHMGTITEWIKTNPSISAVRLKSISPLKSIVEFKV